MNNVPARKLARLETLEATIREGLTKFLEVGKALLLIKEEELYLEAGYTRWSDYCKERWGIPLAKANNYILLNEVAESLDVPDDRLPTAQAHLKQLALIDDPQLRKKAWAECLAKWAMPTAKDVASVVRSYRFKDNPVLTALVLANVITPKQSSELANTLANLPPYYMEAFEQHGFDDTHCITADALQALRSLEYTAQDQVKDVLAQGGLWLGDTFVPLAEVTPADILTVQRQVKAAQYKADQAHVKTVQPDVYYGSQIYDTNKPATIIVSPDGIAPNTIAKALEADGYNIVLVVATKKPFINKAIVGTDLVEDLLEYVEN